MRKLLTIVLLSTCLLGTAQETQFSQFFASSAYFNPAFVGLESTTSLAINYKTGVNEGVGIKNELTHASIVHPLQRVTTFATPSTGFGITFLKEKAGLEGIYQTASALLTAAYVLRFDPKGRRLVAFGLQGGLVQTQVNLSDLQFGSQYNPYLGYDDLLDGENIEENTRMYPNFNVGVVLSITDHHNPILRQNSILLGLSASNINRPADGFATLNKKPIILKGFTTVRLKVSSQFFVHPSAYVAVKTGGFQFNTGLYLSRYLGKQLQSQIQVGTWYRYHDSFIFLAGISYDQIRIGASIDWNSTSINTNEVTALRGFQPTYELSLRYNFQFKDSPIRVSNPLF